MAFIPSSSFMGKLPRGVRCVPAHDVRVGMTIGVVRGKRITECPLGLDDKVTSIKRGGAKYAFTLGTGDVVRVPVGRSDVPIYSHRKAR